MEAVDPFAEPVVRAAQHLSERSGTRAFEVGTDDDGTHFAAAHFVQAAVKGEGRSFAEAAWVLSLRLLRGARCRCGKTALVYGETRPTRARSSCQWRLESDRWVPGCTAPPVAMPAGSRGDYEVLKRVFEEEVGRDG